MEPRAAAQRMEKAQNPSLTFSFDGEEDDDNVWE